MDNQGRVVHQWKSQYEPGQSVYLLENGHLLHCCFTRNKGFTRGGEGGRLEEFDWDGNLVWEFEYSSDEHLSHHDIEPLPNGNILLMAVEKKSLDQCTAAGFNPDMLRDKQLFPEFIIEVEPTRPRGGRIVWEWHVWDHLIQDNDRTKANYGNPAAHPERIDVDCNGRPVPAFWNHGNSIAFNPQLGQIMLSARGCNEIWIIDHSTTTEEAAGSKGGRAGKGGDLLYRWGNPAAYGRGTSDDRQLFQQHDAQWIPEGCPGAGHILVFNNGLDRGYSSVEEIVPAVDSRGRYAIEPGRPFGSDRPAWRYQATNPTDFYSSEVSGAHRLPNGNTLISAGVRGTFFEVTPAGETVWEYVNPVVHNRILAQGERSGPVRAGRRVGYHERFDFCRVPKPITATAMKADELREKYLAFFETKGCVRRESDVLVPRGDPTVLFTPAGMNQFKDHFLGKTKLEFTRATTCQKCLRTGDIDNVGRTPYHHTFFEMLGNFSFGDYFKREAILWAWEFCTDKKWLGLDPEQLSATVYLDDNEAAEIWTREVGLPPEKVGWLGEDENFWPANAPSQGPDGVCGPSSEIYYHSPFGEVEIWNLVFTQFNRVGDPPDNLRPLPSKNIDTGMGLERTAAVLQRVDSNFHIDILRPLVEAAAEACHVKYRPDDENGRRLRRIADHLRACTFAIHEHVYPGPNKQKYVIRRLLRRAVLDGRHMGMHEPFLHQLVGTVAELMQNPYPELTETVGRVSREIEREESNFFGTLDAGLDRIQQIFDHMRARGRGMVAGAEAAQMFTTYGFPPELFETMAAEQGLTFDWEGFRKEMEEHGEKSGGKQKSGPFKTGPLETLKKSMHGTRFVGYDSLQIDEARVAGILVDDQLCERFDQVDHEHPVAVVLDQTPFYGEMGGQVGDAGELAAEGVRFEVVDAQVEDGFTLHRGYLRQGRIAQGDLVSAWVDPARRQGIRRAHSATHLLHYALQKHLGKHAQQQGSKVDRDLLRFDFTHSTAVSPEELDRIEDEVNAKVTEAAPVRVSVMPLVEARKLGATMLFGEKYSDEVRVVSMGQYSKELCGGTHLGSTGQVGLFKIVGEESVSAGTRRITALTGPAALDQIRRNEAALSKTAVVLRVPPEEVPQRVESLVKEVRKLKRQLAAGPRSEGVTVDQLLSQATEAAGVKIVVAEVPEATPPALRRLIDQLRRKAAPVAVMLAARQDEGKVTLIAGLSRDLVERGLDAVQWVRAASAQVEGGGGGRADMAQAGGKDAQKLPQALDTARASIFQMLGAKEKR